MAQVRMRDVIRGSSAGLLVLFLVVNALVFFGGPVELGGDAHAYWLAWRRPELYSAAPATSYAYLYSPAFAQVTYPLTLLPWPVFAVLWSTTLAICLGWLLAPLRWWAVPLWFAGLPEVVSGNIFVVLAVCTVASSAWGGAWALSALTKVSICVGPVWYLARREWRPLLITVGTVAAISAVSYVVAPQLWRQWITFMLGHAGGTSHAMGSPLAPPLAVRLPLAIVLVVWGARGDRRWTLPAGMALASPILWLGTLTLLAAIPRIQRSVHG